MVIAIDLTSLSYHITGIERYALCITEKLLMIDNENRYILVFRNEIYSSLSNYVDGERIIARILHGDNKLLFNQIVLPVVLYGIKADVFLFMAFTSPILFINRKIVTTIHDMVAWDYSQALSFLQKIYCRIGCTISACIAWKIITVSEFSKKRITDILKVNHRKIYVVPSAISDSFEQNSQCQYIDVKQKYKLPDNYIMTLSTLEPRKNMSLLLDAFENIAEKVDYNLVIVGRKGWKIDNLLSKIETQNKICVTGFVEDKEVIEIYKNSMCFVFPSAYEGFGLPPVEALSLGTPVISSDAASMPEVLRKQAVYFKSGNMNELQDLLLKLSKNVNNMPCELDDYQKNNYRFDVSAKKVLSILMDEAVKN